MYVLYDHLQSILEDITYKEGYSFEAAQEKRSGLMFRLKVIRPCHVTGIPGTGYTLWFTVESGMHKDQIVRQAFKMILSFEEHEVREQFRYKGQPIFGPHLPVESLADMCYAEKVNQFPAGKSGAW